MLTLEDINKILGDIKYEDWQFIARPFEEGVMLYPLFTRKDLYSGDEGYCTNMRPWIVEWHRSEPYLVQTVFTMVKLASEHEVREGFMYKGERPYSPHKIDKVLP